MMICTALPASLSLFSPSLWYAPGRVDVRARLNAVHSLWTHSPPYSLVCVHAGVDEPFRMPWWSLAHAVAACTQLMV